MSIRERLAAARKHGFVRSVGVLVGGTALAQGIVALALPLVTRLYSPGDFNVAAPFASALGIAAVSVCLRFDLAVPLPEEDEDAVNILALALSATVLLSAGMLVVVLAFQDPMAGWLRQPRLAPYLPLLPLGVLLAGFYNSLVAWSVRKKEFGIIARTRIGQAFGVAGIQIGFGLLGWSPLGLIVAPVVNGGAGSGSLAVRLLRGGKDLLRAIDPRRMAALFVAYRRFPGYSSLEALANAAGMQVPVIMIAAIAAGPEAGFLALATTIAQAPLGMLGGAIAQVYLSRAPGEHRAGGLGRFTLGTLGGLLKIGVGPLVLLGIVAPDLFALVFGERWRRSGELVAWMTPWSIAQFLAVPVSMALAVTSRQGTSLVLQVSGLILRVASVYLATLIASRPVAESFALSGGVFYAAYLWVVLAASNVSGADFLREVRRAAPIVAAWTGAGLGLALLLRFA